jgi:hypothetical protein
VAQAGPVQTRFLSAWAEPLLLVRMFVDRRRPRLRTPTHLAKERATPITELMLIGSREFTVIHRGILKIYGQLSASFSQPCK